MFKRHTVIRKVYEMQGGGYPFTHIYIYKALTHRPAIGKKTHTENHTQLAPCENVEALFVSPLCKEQRQQFLH